MKINPFSHTEIQSYLQEGFQQARKTKHHLLITEGCSIFTFPDALDIWRHNHNAISQYTYFYINIIYSYIYLYIDIYIYKWSASPKGQDCRPLIDSKAHVCYFPHNSCFQSAYYNCLGWLITRTENLPKRLKLYHWICEYLGLHGRLLMLIQGICLMQMKKRKKYSLQDFL